MASGLVLNKARPAKPLISLVPMIDVMLILLVFFMVTSTYLNLDMIPAVRQQEQASPQSIGDVSAGTILIRLGADGAPVVQGQPRTGQQLSTLLTARVSENPQVQVLILPSGAANTQSLITIMDTATRAGVSRLRVVRLEARP